MESLPIIFARVKPLFEDILKKPTIDKINEFHKQLKSIDENSLQLIQDWFLQRLILLVDQIKEENKNETKLHLIECIKTLLERVKLRDGTAFKTCIFILIKQIYDSNMHKVKDDLSEEMKLTVLQSLSAAGKNLQSDIVEEIYVKDNVHLISQVLYVCTEVLKQEKYRILKFSALDCILSIMQIHNDSDFGDIVIRCQIADLLFIILPKLLASICFIINGDDKIGTSTIVMSIKTLKRILCLIFEDYSNDNVKNISIETFSDTMKEKEKNTEISFLDLNRKNKNDYFTNATRSKKWLNEADKKISTTVILSTVHLRGNQQSQIRLEYAKLCCLLTVKCEKYLKLCVPSLIESTIALTQDEDPKIMKLCSNHLQKISSNIDFLNHNFDEYFNNHLERMPRVLYRSEENAQIASLLLIKGYLSFFSDQQMKMIISNDEVLTNLITMLTIASEFENGNELLRREYPTPMHKDNVMYQNKWLLFKNLKNKQCQKIIQDILKSFHQDEECNEILIHYILDDLYRSKFNCNEYIYLLGYLVTNSNKHTNKIILEELLQPYHWNLDVDTNEEISNQKFNILHICLTLKCLGNLAEIMGFDFKWHVYDSLHFIMQMAGSQINCIHEQAEQTLEAISKALKFKSIFDLLHNNLDYLSQFISKAIKRRENFHEGISVLQSVLHYIALESSSVLENTISPILVDIIDNFSDRSHAKVCLKVLHIFIVAFRKKEKSNGAEIDEVKHKTRNIYSELIMLIDENDIIVDIENENSSAKSDENLYEIDETKLDLPPHIKTIEKILTICSRYVASSDQMARIISLETLECGIHLLKHHENTLLPLVHNIWYTFSERFNENDPIVVDRALDLFITLAILAKDFIRVNAIKDILPKINNFLLSTFGASKSEIQVTRLQTKILQNYAKLIISMQLHEKELNKILDVVETYLSIENHSRIKDAAKQFFEDIRYYDSTAAFLKLK